VQNIAQIYQKGGFYMKKITIIITLLASMLIIAACGDSGSGTPTAGGATGGAGDAPVATEGRTLRVWSFTDEVERHEVIFRGMHPDINVEFAITDLDGGGYEEWVLTTLAAGGAAVPDVIYLEAAIVRSFVEGPFLMDLSDLLPLAEALETYQFVLDIGTYDGEARAFSWQATPGAMFYRRSFAEQIFGTDDPDTIQNYFRDIPTALDSARRIRDESNGSMFFTNHFGAFNMPFNANRSNPWIVDNNIYVDPIMHDFIDFAYTVRHEGLDAQVSNWSPEWFSSMSDEFTDIAGNPLSIFSYMLPTWGLAHVIYANHGPHTFGDWALIPGPLPYQWGGTWIGVPRAANNPDLGRLFVESLALNPEFMANWALGVYTHEYLLQIDPTLHSGVFQGGGDFVSSAAVVRDITDQFDGTEIYHFLGGQNPYEIFGVAAPLLDLSLIQAADSTIQAAFGEAVDLYVDGLNTREEAMAFFEQNVRMAMPWLN